MGRREKRAYLEQIRDRYRKAKRVEKAKILDEFCAVCNYHRKYAIRLLSLRQRVKPARRVGRKPLYDRPEVVTVVRRIWLATDHVRQTSQSCACLVAAV